MRLRKAIKRIAAFGVGAAFIGSTMMGAMAADLSTYPAPFISNGVFSGVLVVGDKAAAEDVIGVSDLASSLQFAATKKAGTTTTTTTVEGDSYLVKASGDSLNLNQNLSDVKQILDSNDLKALSDGTISNEKGTYTYKQYLQLGASSGGGGGSVVTYTTDDVSPDDPAFYLKFYSDLATATDPDGTEAYAWKLQFPTSLKSDIDSSNDLDDLDNKKLSILGKEYTIVNTEFTGSGNVQRPYGILTLDLMGGAWSGTMQEGEEKTIKINDKDYVTKVDIITDSGTRTAKLTINGETTDEMGEPSQSSYPWSYKMTDGTELGIKSIMPNEAGDVTQDQIEFYLGAQKMSIEDNIEGNITGTLYMSGDSVTDLVADITGSNSTGDVEISSIEIWWEAGDDYYVPVGGKLSEQLSADEKDILLSNLDFYLGGVNLNDKDTIKLSPNGDNKYKFSAKNKDGEETSLDLFYYTGGNILLAKGDAAKNISVVELGAVTSVPKNCFFLVEKNKYSHLVEVDKFDATSNYLYLKDFATSKQTKHSYTNGGGAVDFYKNGNKFTVTVNAAEDAVGLTDITDGEPSVPTMSTSFTGGQNSTFYTEHEAVIKWAAHNATGMQSTETGTAFNGTLILEDEDGQQDSSTTVHQLNVSITHDGTRLQIGTPGSTSPGFAMKAWDTDTYKETAYTDWGTYVVRDTSGNQDTITIEYPGSEATADVYVLGGVVTTSTGGESAESVTINKIEVGATKLASEVADVKAQNTIIVGGPCANPRAADALGNPADCAAGFEAGKGLIQLVEFDNGKVALLVAGYSAADTRAATTVLANYKDNAADLKGKKVEVTTATSKVSEVTAAATTTTTTA